MEKLLIRFKTIDDVRRFVDVTSLRRSSVTLSVGNYTVDGKSIMGIFSLDLKKTVTVSVEGEDSDELVKALAPFEADRS